MNCMYRNTRMHLRGLNRHRPPARYALTRLPEKLAAHPLSQALFGLLAATSERQYEHIYSRAESLFHYAQQPDFLDPKLGDVVALMTKAFVGSSRQLWFIDSIDLKSAC